MDSKEELSKLLFDAATAISGIMSNIEFGKDDRNMIRANKFRKWLVEYNNTLCSQD